MVETSRADEPPAHAIGVEKPTRVEGGSAYIPVHGPWVRHFRKRAGLEIDDLAAAIGKSQSHTNKIELGYAPRTSVRTFHAIRRALGLTPEQGVYIAGNPSDVAALLLDTADDADEGAA